MLLIAPSGMAKDRDKMAERILHLTLEILFRLTGEDYTVVKKTSSERCQAPVSEGWGRPLSPITGPHPPIHEDINDQKILELTYKMIELLTGEPSQSPDIKAIELEQVVQSMSVYLMYVKACPKFLENNLISYCHWEGQQRSIVLLDLCL
ncbi:oocyte zinc finger protein XlCOF29-like [Anomaloglossus baeobatrachus]|uniref:oocyte zinc finger protein XlCOF29-like n=1 Tax=Anomaloglossus baeobatrachus TaxID=238106 RepID=UPI003F50652E